MHPFYTVEETIKLGLELLEKMPPDTPIESPALVYLFREIYGESPDFVCTIWTHLDFEEEDVTYQHLLWFYYIRKKLRGHFYEPSLPKELKTNTNHEDIMKMYRKIFDSVEKHIASDLHVDGFDEPVDMTLEGIQQDPFFNCPPVKEPKTKRMKSSNEDAEMESPSDDANY